MENDSNYRNLLNLAIFNDIIDILLFIIGLLVIYGDYFETSISFIIDIILYLRLIARIHIVRKKPYLFLLLMVESLDFLDIIFGGFFDIFGWIEVIPLWTIFIWTNSEDFYNRTSLNRESNRYIEINNKNKEYYKKIQRCPNCSAEFSEDIDFCEKCGISLSKT